MKKRFLSMLVLLAAVVSGAWAQTTINVTAGDLGKAVCTDGSIYDNVDAAQSAGKTAVAKIICLDTQNSKALALSLDNQAVTPGTVDYATAQSRCEALNTTLAVTFGTWVLPSKAQWEAIIEAAGGYQALRDEFAFLFGGTKMEAVPYWSSTAGTTGHWLINFYDGKWEDGTYNSSARACLVINLPQTYSVTLADGTEDAGNWTISPAEATEGAEVTATYSGEKKVKSVKAVKKAPKPKLGDLFYSDGTFSSTLEAGKTPIGVIAYLDQEGTDDDEICEKSNGAGHGLVLCLKDAASAIAWSTEISAFEFDEDAKVADVNALKRTTNVSGYTNTKTLAEKTDAATKYKAAYAAKSYTGLTAPTGTTGWFLPSAQQWVKMQTGLGALEESSITWNSSFDNNHEGANKWEAALSKAGSGNYDSMTSANLYYWSSSEYSAGGAVNLNVCATGTGYGYGFWWYYNAKGDGGTNSNFRVRPVLAF